MTLKSLRYAACLVAALPLIGLAQPASQVRLGLPDGQIFTDPVGVSFNTPFTFNARSSDTLKVAVAPRYEANLATAWFEMAAGVSIASDCSLTICSDQRLGLGGFIITQPIKLVSPDRRPIEVTASFTTLADIGLPEDAWIVAQFKLGLLSGSYSQRPFTNFWQGCWANSDAAAALAQCASVISERMPLDTVATRTVTVSVTSGSTLQLEVFSSLQMSVPVTTELSSFTGTMLLDPWINISVPQGTIVESGSFPVLVVPEPATVWLFVLGLLALWWGRTRHHIGASPTRSRTRLMKAMAVRVEGCWRRPKSERLMRVAPAQN